MAMEYKLSYTAPEINEKLGKIYDIVHTTGDSTSFVMSQKAITDQLDAFRVFEKSETIIGKNIFNPNAVIPNKRIEGSTIVDDTNNNAISQIFNIKSGETAITISYVTGGGTHQLQPLSVVFYDSEMKAVQTPSVNSTYTIPQGAEYFVINLGNIFNSVLHRIMVEYNTTKTEFEPYSETIVGDNKAYIKPEWLGANIVQEIGEQNDKVMSQKAVAEEFNTIRDISTEEVLASKNFFNPNDLVLNKQVLSDGKIISSENYFCSQVYEVPEGETYITTSYVTSSGTHQGLTSIISFYDSGRVCIQPAQSNITHAIPSDAKFFIICLTNDYIPVAHRVMAEFHDEMTEFEAFEKIIKTKIKIKNDCIDFVETAQSRNQYNYKTKIDGATMNTDGTVLEHSYRSVSDFIPCFGQKIFSAGTGAEGVYCFYDKNKNFISPYGVFSNGTTNITIPDGAHYLRVSLRTFYSNTFTIAFTKIAIPYEKYEGSYTSINSTLDKKSCKSIISEVLASGGTIKLLGDSITHGVGGSNFNQDGVTIPNTSTDFKVNTSGYCWANLFKDYIVQKYGNVVYNYGTRGIRSYNIIEQMVAKNGYVSSYDDLLIIMIGTNNKWATTNDTLDDLRNDLQWIIDWCEDNGKKLILISAPMSTVLWDTQYSDGTMVKFHNEDIDHIYKEVTYKNNMDYIPMYQRMVEYCDLKDINIDTIFDDGLHPNDKGYYIMYKILMRELGLAYQMPNSAWDNASPQI